MDEKQREPGGVEAERPRDESDTEPALNIVALGASAGGLTALKTLFSKLPGDTGATFVVVVHLSPEHESHLPELLQPHTTMPVQQVTETTPLEANHVYIIPPNANLNTIDTHLRLSELEENRRDRATVDHFFRTLADTHDGNAIGVILTGSGSDGTLGIRRIKEAGGVTLAQDPEEAEQGGMPRSAIASGMVDRVLTLDAMAEEIVRLLESRPRILAGRSSEESAADDERLVQKIFAQVRARTGRDFSHYKRSTAMRRTARRMQIRHVETLSDYLDVLRQDREEIAALANDLLITVTEFFRDEKIFQHLEEEVIPGLFEGKTSSDTIRVWSVGCSTGEEAYSLAMLLTEESSRRDEHPNVQVFASDLHPQALVAAREGIYPKEIESDVTPERIRRFFSPEHGSYRVRRDLREMVVFTEHNILSDPPFSHLDMVVCRNLLIYLQRDVQRDVISLFHYALGPGGLLVLGSSETADQAELFKLEDKDAHVYRRRHAPPQEKRLPPFPLVPTRRPRETGEPHEAGEEREPARRPGYGQMHAQFVEHYAPPSVLINAAGDIVHSSIRAGRYLVMPGGEPTGNVVRLVREPLQMELRALMHQARESGEGRRSNPISVRFNGETGRVVLRVIPSRDRDSDGYLLVIFDEQVDDGGKAEGAAPGDHSSSATVRELEAELELNRQRLQATVEEYETSREELQSSNEELQSSNEELRSTLEELETSKEELQSMNEELATVNQESTHRVEQLGQLADDLQNLLASTNIATLFLDQSLKIVRFTPAVGELFNIRHSDRGRPLTDLTHHLEYPEIERDARRVLGKLSPIEREVKASPNGQWYLTRLLPYRAGENRIEGVVITLIDITARKKAEEETEEARIYAESIVETLHEPLLVLHPDLTVKSANDSFFTHFRVRKEETLGRKIYDLGNGQWDIPDLHTLLENVLPENYVFEDYEVSHTFDGLGKRVMLLNGRRLDHVQMILLGIRDITSRKAAEEGLRQSEERYRALFESIDAGFCIIEMLFDEDDQPTDYRFLKVNPAFEDQTGIEDAVGRRMREISPEHEEFWFETYGRIATTGESARFEHEAHSLGRIYDVYAFRVEDPALRRVAILFRDVTEPRQSEQLLRESEERLRRIFDIDVVSVAIFNMERGVFVDCNDAFLELIGRDRSEVASGGLSWQDMTAPEFVDVVQEQVDRLRETGRLGPAEKQVERPDGSRRWILFAGADLGDGTVVEYAIDLEEHKRVERELEEARAELERRVAERTSELRVQAGRLRRLAGELAQAEHRERKRLASLLHDELQQLLAAAKMRLQSARRKTEDERIIPAMDKSIELLGEAIESSRDLTQQLRPPVLYEDGLVPAIRWLASEMEDRHNLHVEVEAEETQLELPGDARAMLFSAVRELLFNVVKHARVEEVLVRAYREDNKLVVCVEDDGGGFDAGRLEKQKEPSGLGLFSVREHLAALGGEMRIDSDEGKGTCIELVMPIDALEEGSAASLVASDLEWADRKSDEHADESIHVLLVDDHAMVRQGVAEMLSHHEGIRVVAEAGDGAEAIELAAAHRPDVVLMDVNLPKVSGVEATREIRKRWPEVAVIGISVQAGDAMAQSMLSAGAAAFVAKTESPQELIDLIKRHARPAAE